MKINALKPAFKALAIFALILSAPLLVHADDSIVTAIGTASGLGWLDYASSAGDSAENFKTINAGTLTVNTACFYDAHGTPSGGITVYLEADSGGLPSGTPIATGSIADSDITASLTPVAVSGISGIAVTANTQYWLVFSNTNGSFSTTANYGNCGDSTLSYANGQLWIARSGTVGAGGSWDNGGSPPANGTLYTESTVITSGGPPPSPPVSSIAGLIGTSSYENFGSTTGYDLQGILDFFRNDVLVQSFAVVLGFVYILRWWIAAGLIFGGVLYFVGRAFIFFNH